jgi:ribulose-phosphate 3-epimerase
VVKAIRPFTKKIFDVHLMIAPAEPYLAAFAEAGADIITIHPEAGPHLDRSLSVIRSLGKKAGVAINLSTPESTIEYALDKIDLILAMTINPGFGGQSYIPAATAKIAKLKKMIGDRPIDLEVDGGITAETAPIALNAGANVLVAGSAIFKGDPAQYKKNIDAIRAAQPRAAA